MNTCPPPRNYGFLLRSLSTASSPCGVASGWVRTPVAVRPLSGHYTYRPGKPETLSRAFAFAPSRVRRPRVRRPLEHMRLLHLLLPTALGLRWFPLDAAAPATRGTAGARPMALYPLPALYLPGATCMVRNVQLRNIAMCKVTPLV